MATVLSAGIPARALERAPAQARPFVGPTLVGEHVALRLITPNDYPFLHEFEGSSRNATHWRQRGLTLPAGAWTEDFERRGNLAEFFVVDRQTGKAVGHVFAYGQNHRDGVFYLAAARFDHDPKRKPINGLSTMLFGVGLFIQYVFVTWPMRKLKMEVPEYNYAQIEELSAFFETEGILRAESFLDGKWWDVRLLALRRETWMSNAWIQEAVAPSRPPE